MMVQCGDVIDVETGYFDVDVKRGYFDIDRTNPHVSLFAHGRNASDKHKALGVQPT
jgi:hypothetical protein